MMNIQNYVQAESLEEAYQLNQKRSGRIIGGMLWMKMARNTVGTAIDLCRLGLDTMKRQKTNFPSEPWRRCASWSSTRA